MPAALKLAGTRFPTRTADPHFAHWPSGLVIRNDRARVLFLVQLCNPHLRLAGRNGREPDNRRGVFVKDMRGDPGAF